MDGIGGATDATTEAARARIDSDNDRPTVKRGRVAPNPRRQEAVVQPARLKPSRLRLLETRSEYADDLMQGIAGVIHGIRRISAIVDGLAKHLGFKMALKKCFTWPITKLDASMVGATTGQRRRT